MGLDSVEIVLQVEETFGITIPDEEASQIATIGDLYQLILSKLRLGRSDRCLTARAFYRLRQALIGEGVAARKAIRPHTPLDEVVPPATRRRVWPLLERRISMGLPALCRPPLLERSIDVLFLLWLAMGLLAMKLWSLRSGLWVVVAAIAAVKVAYFATRRLATIPVGYSTVGDVAKAVLRDNYAKVSAELAAVNEKEAWEALTGLISYQLNVPQAELKPETRFVQDLKID